MRINKQIWLTLGVAGLISLLSAWFHYQASGYQTISLEIRTNTELETPVFQLFYDLGRGYRERDSHSFLLQPGESFQQLSYTIPSHTIHGLRLDFLNGPGQVTLRQLTFHPADSDYLAPAPQVQLHFNQAEPLNHSPAGLTIRTRPEANDPFVQLSLEQPICHPCSHPLWPQLLFALKVFTFLGLCLGTVLLLTRR
ncbi:hypothetical protein [Desulfogranum mediterraneum]|uniref:hypothetical protein n=1 Tax=Desulfogranum mediterraneum TaxID=160661 RepID=UPI000410C9D2|nr:hypothetical protein [Desulfogranum mediterraneum]